MFTVLEMSKTSRPKAEPKYVTYDYFQQQLKSIDNATKQYTRNYINNTVSAIQSNVVNYSAISNQSKSLTDGVRTIDFDSITQSIQFRTNINQTTTPIKIHPITNTINNVSKINFNDNSTITGITSDSSNTDPTKAISANILTDLNSRFTTLEDKTQNQTATENETTFTGNVTADTFNGYNLGMNNSFYKLPAIPVIKDDLVMEVGRYIDFHRNASTGVDKTSRLYISKLGTLHCDHSFIVDGGDIKARNCISDNGNLHDAINKIAALESKNTEQDTRLDNLESKDIAHEERMGSIEAMDTAQNETISNINTKNDEQDTRLDTLETKNTEQDTRLDTLDRKDLEQDTRLDTLETKNTEQDTRLNTIENETIPSITTAISNINNDIGIMASEIDALESKDIAHEERIGSIEAMDTAQNESIGNINTKNDEQDTRLNTIESKNTEQDERLDALETKDTEQDTRLDTLESKTYIPYDNKLYNTYTVSFTPTLYQLLSTSITFELITDIPADLNTNNNSMEFGSFNWGVFQDPAAVSRTLSVSLFISTGGKTIITAKDNFGHDVTASYVYNGHQFVYRITFDISIGSSSSASISDIATAMINTIKAYEVQNVSIVSKNLKIDNEERLSSVESKISNLLDKIYPVGSIYLSLTKSPPSLGGTWELIDEGKFLYSTTSTSGETGGSTTHSHETANHVLTVDEIPAHYHGLKGYGPTLGPGDTGWRFGGYGSKLANNVVTNTGGDQPHNHGKTYVAENIPPYITCFMYKRTA